MFHYLQWVYGIKEDGMTINGKLTQNQTGSDYYLFQDINLASSMNKCVTGTTKSSVRVSRSIVKI
jgi:hypothetical protein